MAKLTDEHLKDFVAFAKAKTYENTSALMASWREWLLEMYGDRCVTIDGRIYPPESQPTETFRGSILWKGDTAAEKRLIKSQGIAAYWDTQPDEFNDDAVKSAQQQLDEIRKKRQKGAA